MKVTAAGAFAGVATLAVALAVAAGLWLIGPPSLVRAHRLDDERLRGLQSLQTAVETYHDQQGALPDSLEAALQGSAFLSPSQARDPDTGRPYEYRKTSATSYELCAQFALASGEDEVMQWRHEPGHACFTLQVKPSKTAVQP